MRSSPPRSIRAQAKRLAVMGAVTLWIISPLLIGGFITVATRTINAGGAHGVVLAGFVLWGLACLAALTLGFCLLLGGIFLWWRSRHPAAITRTRPVATDRARLLRELRDDLADDEPSHAATDEDPARSEDSAR